MNWTNIAAQIGGAVLHAASTQLARTDFSGLGQYQGFARIGSLLALELSQALNAKWNPQPATPPSPAGAPSPPSPIITPSS